MPFIYQFIYKIILLIPKSIRKVLIKYIPDLRILSRYIVSERTKSLSFYRNIYKLYRHLPIDNLPADFIFESGKIYIKTSDNILLWFNEDAVNPTMWHYDANHLHEKAERQMLCKTIVPNSTILDIGGGCGIHAITFARIDRSIRVHTFEPAINTYNTLIRNLERNGVAGQVTCHNIALSDNCENLYISNRYGPTDHVVKNMNDIRLDKANQIKSTTVDDFVFENCLSVDGIKIDVEGFEYYVLKGAAKTILNYKPWIYLEAIPSHLKRYNLKLNDLYQILLSYGYEIFWVNPVDAQLIPYTNSPQDICNLFCTQKNKS